MAPVVYLVSGSNRGIGLGLIKALIQRPNVVVFAGARDPSSSSDLQNIAKTHRENLHIIKLISADKDSNARAVAEINSKAGKLDVVIANAAIANAYAHGTEVSPEAMLEHFNVNTLGPLMLFQSCWPLLQKSTATPKFVAVTSGAGSIAMGAAIKTPMIAYGTSKAALNYVTRKLHTENENLIAFSITPGGVNTDMLREYVKNAKESSSQRPATVEQAVEGLLREVDAATRETHGDALLRASGGKWEW